MKQSFLIKALLTLVVVGSLGVSVYSIASLNDSKKETAKQVAITKKIKDQNESTKKLVKEKDTKLAAISTELKELKKELSKYNEEQRSVEIASDKNVALPETDNIATDSMSEQSRQELDEFSKSENERLTKEAEDGAKELEVQGPDNSEPVYVNFEGSPYRFALLNGISEDELLSLNGLSSTDDLEIGKSYRVK